MKKVYLSLALAATVMMSAQIDWRSTRFGLTAGGNYSKVSNAHNPSGPRYTIQAGALALIPIDSNDQFYIQPELTYYGAGETGKDKNAKGMPGYDAVYANDYISVPIYFKGYFSEAESEFFGMIGPRFNFLVNQKVKNAVKDYYDSNDYGKAATFNFALGAGIGFSYKRQLEFAVRYDFGLSNTFPDLRDSPDTSTGDASVALKKAQHVFNIGLSYIFE